MSVIKANRLARKAFKEAYLSVVDNQFGLKIFTSIIDGKQALNIYTTSYNQDSFYKNYEAILHKMREIYKRDNLKGAGVFFRQVIVNDLAELKEHINERHPKRVKIEIPESGYLHREAAFKERCKGTFENKAKKGTRLYEIFEEMRQISIEANKKAQKSDNFSFYCN